MLQLYFIIIYFIIKWTKQPDISGNTRTNPETAGSMNYDVPTDMKDEVSQDEDMSRAEEPNSWENNH